MKCSTQTRNSDTRGGRAAKLGQAALAVRAALILGCALLIAASALAADSQPNFIFFITDDISPDDLGCYGNPIIRTPNLDRMAAGGMVFDNAYLTISSCSPSRCSMITGRYPHNTGAPELHTELPADQWVYPEALMAAGYYTVLSGKHHMGDAVNRAFHKVSRGGPPGGHADWVEILHDRPKDKPFFFWFASNDAHRRWQHNWQAPEYDPDLIRVPPFLFDGPQTRQDLAEYYHEVSRTDTVAGDLMRELEWQGIADETYFIYIADNGRPFPRCKTRLYDSGIKTPLIIRNPGAIEPGRTMSLVSSIDIAATILELAGLEQPASVQGVSLVPILKDPKAKVRDYAFAEHNWHVYQNHERMVRYGHWMYIRNAWPERMNRCVESDDEFPAGAEIWAARDRGALRPEQMDIFLAPRPAEELYNVKADPHQIHNLAGRSEYDDVLKEMRAVLDRWTEETGDTVQTNPTRDRPADRSRNLEIGEFPGAAAGAARINRPGPVLAGR